MVLKKAGALVALLLTSCAAGALEDATTAQPEAEADAIPAPSGEVDGGEGSLGPETPAKRSSEPVEVSEVATVTCSRTGLLPVALADIDDDGEMERVAARWIGGGFKLTIHTAPDLETERTLEVKADSLELAVTRRTGRETGDLWVHSGRVVDSNTNRWEFRLERFEGGSSPPLRTLWKGESSARPNLRLDLDGDGRVDPIVQDKAGPRAMLSKSSKQLTLKATPNSFHGAPAPFGREEPVDLDGDGDRDVVVSTSDGLHVVELPSLRSVWSYKSVGSLSGIVAWPSAPGGYAIHAYLSRNGEMRLYGADKAHTLLASFSRADGYARVMPLVDPAGDGSTLALNRAVRTDLLAAPSAKRRELEVRLVTSADPADPRSQPAKLAGGDQPEIVAYRELSHGSPGLGGTGETVYELRALEATYASLGRLIRRGAIQGDGSPSPQVLDFDGDGELEILLSERSGYMTCDMSGGGLSSQWLLLRGDGTLLWEDEVRHATFGDDNRNDDQARVALIELGPGLRGLRFRTARQEFWVFAKGHTPAYLPHCIE